MRASAKYIWIIIVVLFVGGFLLAQTSGLLGRAPVTSTTAAASVNGEDILATTWYQTTQNLEQEATQRGNQSISLDERQRLMDQAFDQVASDVYVTDEQLWRRFQDQHDSAQISFVAFDPERISDSAVRVSDDEVRAYYDTHKKLFERSGTAKISIIIIPRAVSPADSAAVRAHALALRARILGGEKFEDVARAESADSGSAVNGGSLGKGPKGRFVAPFENAAFALKPGEISQPVLTPFGYHLIKVDERKGDTISVRHILLRIQQSDSAAARTDRRADSLARMAASTDQPAKFDEAARTLHIPVIKSSVVLGNAVTVNGQFIPSVGPWTFQGARPGETSELFDAEDGYYLARLDSLTPGGTLLLDQAKNDIRAYLLRQKKIDALLPQAYNFAKVAAASSLESAANLMNLKVVKTKPFTRVTGVQELAQAPEAVGAAFSLPLRTVSEPIRSTGLVVVERVDNRFPASRAAFETQKDVLRQQALATLRRQRVSEFLANLRAVAKIDDRRKQVEASARRTTQ